MRYLMYLKEVQQKGKKGKKCDYLRQIKNFCEIYGEMHMIATKYQEIRG